MDVHLDVARGLDGEVEEAVLRPGFEHVAEERNRRPDLRRAGAIHVESDGDLRLLGLALDPRLAGRPLLAHRDPPSVRISAAARWPPSPSTSASTLRCGRAAASPALEYSMTLARFTKSSTPSGEEKRAVPAVGSTWLGPAT